MAAEEQGLVLIVDDNELASYVKERTVRAAGFRTHLTALGEEAVRFAKEMRPDCVLLDIKLPDIDGFEVCRRLRENPATASTAIVQISATFEAPEYQVRGLEGGADTFLVAPVEPTVLVATVRAMMRLRRAEAQLREFDRRKDEFLATLAHELRNPVAPLLYCVESLPPQIERGAGHEKTLRIMKRQTKHLIRLVDDLVDISRITQNKLTLRRSPVVLQQIIEMAFEANRAALEDKRQSLTIELPEAPVELHADAVRLTQVFGNLISNAVKYTGNEGQIRIVGEVRPDGVEVSVIDTGVGISREDLDRIFELFVQIREPATGLGIGLALVHRLVEMHGGTVTATSEGADRGSTFTVRLPIGTAPAAVEAAAESSPEPSAPRKILVVDDNADAVDSLASLLRAMGHAVMVGYGGQEALRLADEFEPEFVFMDISMPDMNGRECIARLRTREWSKSTVICALSGHGRPTDQQRSEEAGADLHIVKPAGLETLREILARPRDAANG